MFVSKKEFMKVKEELEKEAAEIRKASISSYSLADLYRLPIFGYGSSVKRDRTALEKIETLSNEFSLLMKYLNLEKKSFDKVTKLLKRKKA